MIDLVTEIIADVKGNKVEDNKDEGKKEADGKETAAKSESETPLDCLYLDTITSKPENFAIVFEKHFNKPGEKLIKTIVCEKKADEKFVSQFLTIPSSRSSSPSLIN